MMNICMILTEQGIKIEVTLGEMRNSKKISGQLSVGSNFKPSKYRIQREQK